MPKNTYFCGVKNTTYEAAYEELRGILAELQEGTVSIDDLSKKVARAQALLDYCREKLRTTEAAIQALNPHKPTA